MKSLCRYKGYVIVDTNDFDFIRSDILYDCNTIGAYSYWKYDQYDVVMQEEKIELERSEKVRDIIGIIPGKGSFYVFCIVFAFGLLLLGLKIGIIRQNKKFQVNINLL